VTAIAVTVLHRPVQAPALDGWLAAVRAGCDRVDGFVGCVVSVHPDERLELALAVEFADEAQLCAWLDGPEWAALLVSGAAAGIRRASSDLVIDDGEPTPAGVGVFRHSVLAGRVDEFTSAQSALVDVSAGFAGYEGTVVVPTSVPGEWLSLIRFRTERQLAGWLGSRQRAEALPSLRSTLRKDFSTMSSTTPLGTTVRTSNGKTVMTPNWKSAMLVLLVLYPAVMVLSRFFGPMLDAFGAEPWLALWVSQVISVSALQWWLMPAVTRPFRRWLDPVDGAGLRISVIGGVTVVALYAVTLAVFASVKWLQFWDYMD
jgi:antibiotic biosynthesis monooxygenase (ABM) superfamily enzyme